MPLPSNNVAAIGSFVVVAITEQDVACTALHNLVNPIFWLALFFGACVANLCYLVGPAVEGYGSYFGIWHPNMTSILFVAGTGFTMLLALASVAGF